MAPRETVIDARDGFTVCRSSKITLAARVAHLVTRLARRDGRGLLRAELETGRTHQIRVHLSNWGYPIVGDKLYGLKNDFIPENDPTFFKSVPKFGQSWY